MSNVAFRVESFVEKKIEIFGRSLLKIFFCFLCSIFAKLLYSVLKRFSKNNQPNSVRKRYVIVTFILTQIFHSKVNFLCIFLELRIFSMRCFWKTIWQLTSAVFNSDISYSIFCAQILSLLSTLRKIFCLRLS